MQDKFGDAQKAFFFKHKDTFTDDEENKLEYTQIFEAYVQLLEEIIDADLNYSQEQMTAFYQHFADNLKVYEESDALAMNTLFGLTNFDKFKESILMFKRDEASTFKSNE